MTTHPVPSSPARPLLARLVGALLAAAVLTGCGVRIDSGPEEPSPASVTEQWRQDAAVEAAGLASATRTLAEGLADDVEQPGLGDVLAELADGLDAQADALGGVWVAWPDGPPEGMTNRPVADPPVVTDVAALRGLLGVSADRTVGVLADLPATERDVASVLASVATGRILQAATLDQFVDGDSPVLVATPGPELVAEVADGPTVLVLDQARYLEETLAARGLDEGAVERARDLQVLVDAALEAGAPDTREPAYPWPDGGPAEFRRVSESDLLDQWIFLAAAAPGPLSGGLVDAAAVAALRLRDAGVEPGPLPGLPGGRPVQDAESPTS